MMRSSILMEVTRAMSMEHRCLFQAMRSDVCEPWGYVAPVIAAVVTRATGVRHIYLIEIFLALGKPKHHPEQSSSCIISSLSGKIPVKDRGDIVNSFNREGSGPQVSIKWIKSFI